MDPTQPIPGGSGTTPPQAASALSIPGPDSSRLRAMAMQILTEQKFDQEKAFAALVVRIREEDELLQEVIYLAATTALRNAAFAQRSRLGRETLETPPVPTPQETPPDDTSGLAAIAEDTQKGYLKTYLVMNKIPLGECKRPDLIAAVQWHSRLIDGNRKSIRFFEPIIKRFKDDDTRVDAVFSEREIVTLARNKGDKSC